jgi:hypothetical protein
MNASRLTDESGRGDPRSRAHPTRLLGEHTSIMGDGVSPNIRRTGGFFSTAKRRWPLPSAEARTVGFCQEERVLDD